MSNFLQSQDKIPVSQTRVIPVVYQTPACKLVAFLQKIFHVKQGQEQGRGHPTRSWSRTRMGFRLKHQNQDQRFLSVNARLWHCRFGDRLISGLLKNLRSRTTTTLIPLTHAPETGARNRRQKTGVGFWSVCHTIWRQIFLAPDSGVG